VFGVREATRDIGSNRADPEKSDPHQRGTGADFWDFFLETGWYQ
jgi:hypothetical protein